MHDRILGIVGGVGPESTIDYYRTIVAGWRARRPDGSFPRVIIDSVEAGAVLRLVGAGDLHAVGRHLGAAVAELAAAGCGCALIASNATHLGFEHIDPPPVIPLIHIVGAARDAAVQRGYRRLGIIGTRMAVESSLYPDRFVPAGIEIVRPTPEEIDTVHDIYMGELVEGVILDESRDRLVAVIAAMRDRDGIDGAILGGTELALTLTGPAYAGVPIVNTAKIHAEAAVDWLLGVTEVAGPARLPA